MRCGPHFASSSALADRFPRAARHNLRRPDGAEVWQHRGVHHLRRSCGWGQGTTTGGRFFGFFGRGKNRHARPFWGWFKGGFQRVWVGCALLGVIALQEKKERNQQPGWGVPVFFLGGVPLEVVGTGALGISRNPWRKVWAGLGDPVVNASWSISSPRFIL